MYYQEIKSVRVKQTQNQFFAGYFAYWKLIIEAEKVANEGANINAHVKNIVAFVFTSYVFGGRI